MPKPLPRCQTCGGTTWVVVERPHPLYRGLTPFAIPCDCKTGRVAIPVDSKAAAAGRDA